MLNTDWNYYLENEYNKDYFISLMNFIKSEYQNHTVFPAENNIFNALNLTPYKDTKVVIIGQDPYPGPGQAHGLSFSVQPGTTIPRSLNNIFKELTEDLSCNLPAHGHLKKWAEEGVLLLNAVLTVRAGESRSHYGKGWEKFTNKIIETLNSKAEPVVFVLWGNDAKKKKILITNPKHLVIESAHPSPLSASRGFLGSKPFSRANDFLINNGIKPIDWQIS